MGRLDRLFRRNPSQTSEPNAGQVKEFLDCIERLPADDPRSAVNALIAEGPLKTRFGDLTLKVITAELRYRNLPACKIISAEKVPGVIFDDRFVSAHGYPLHQLRREA